MKYNMKYNMFVVYKILYADFEAILFDDLLEWNYRAVLFSCFKCMLSILQGHLP